MKRVLDVKEEAIRRINFLAKDDLGLRYKQVDVDLSKLSGLALLLANLIVTTENRDDLSHVHIESTKTYRELQFLEGKSEAYVADLEKVYGFDFLDKKPIMTWSWDCLRRSETPEEFFRRHAYQISKLDGEVIGSHRYYLELRAS